MAGTVFLSCGQNDRELKIAERVAGLLRESFQLEVFIARATNNMYSLNNDVLARLASADYFIFVNFHRESEAFPGSLYSHQELAMALALGHRRFLLFSEQGAPNVGITQFIVQNRPSFSNEGELLNQIRNDVEREQWRPEYSRFLRAREIVKQLNVTFSDGAGNLLSGTSISVTIENQSSDLQDSVIVTLERLDGNEPDYLFRSPLKISGQRRYDATIPAESSVLFNIIMEGTRKPPEQGEPGAFLVSALDLSPLPALFSDQEQHEMEFRLDARAHRPIRFRLVRRNREYALA
ncbi:MAG TPA: hypothetical protein VFA33_18020 [Bryobacteraceae bacterium]|nr:hypothetical protein [Bryobacteraceae bacterium]